MSKDEPDVDEESRDESDVEALRLTLEESRQVMDHQIALFDEIDDKAMRSVRTAVIVVGFVVSAFGIAGPGAITQLGISALGFGVMGVLFLLVTIFAGIGTYTVSDIPYGIGPSYRDEVRRGYSEREWIHELLEGYDEWSEYLEEEEARNRRYLDVTQFSLFTGSGMLSLSAGVLILRAVTDLSSPVAATTLVIALSVLLPLLRRYGWGE
ncbi:hypothetical protein GCM10009037_07000 [Halarchaeum grantii]|uniref:Uncharacterized protein n=1 Tax=Halarchaeum grantii TaxID=1193105 RepID=A0A830EZR4_9EURY|nr:hypothetical protein [Halarchaeum grantii]GGL25966.1 hypothetical protein GCM10009037_07000 [Halarchaeum grantii]